MGKEQLPLSTTSRRKFIQMFSVLMLSPRETLQRSLKYYSQGNPSPAPTDEIVYEPEPTPEKKIALYKDEFEEVVMPLFLENHDLIKILRPNGALGNLETLRMYYPIYCGVTEKFGVPWWIQATNHDSESTCSQNRNAFLPGRSHFGAVQRSTALYPDSEVEEAVERLEWLKDLPQEHPTDYRELAWFGLKFHRDAQAELKRRPWKDWNWALEDAQFSFLGEGGEIEAAKRIERFRVLKSIFE